MKAIARSANHDLFVVAGQLAMADGRIAQGQILEAAILTVKGELQFDIERGIPYFETIFASQKFAPRWRAKAIERTMEFDWVQSVDSLTYSIDSHEHTINYTMTVTTNLGTVTITGVDYNIITPKPDSDGGGGMENLTQNGIFYLPVAIEGGVQVYRQLREYINADMGGVTTELSEKTYIKNSDGVFVERS